MKEKIVEPRFASVKHVTKVYGISRATVDRRIADRSFSGVKAGSKILIELTSVESYFASLPKVGPTLQSSLGNNPRCNPRLPILPTIGGRGNNDGSRNGAAIGDAFPNKAGPTCPFR